MTLRSTEPRPQLETAVLERVTTLLCDADDTLFPSEARAFEASVDVLNRWLAAAGIDRPVTAEEQRARAVGKNFRATVTDLAAEHGVGIQDLGTWVAEEAAVVTEHLRTNVATIRAFLDRTITIEGSGADGPGRVVIA